MRPGEEKIFDAIRLSDKPLSFSELQETTGLSSPALSGYLKGFLKLGVLIKDRDSGHYHVPAVAEWFKAALVKMELLDMDKLHEEEIRGWESGTIEPLKWSKNRIQYAFQTNFVMAISAEDDLSEREEYLKSLIVDTKDSIMFYFDMLLKIILAAGSKLDPEEKVQGRTLEEILLEENKEILNEYIHPLISVFIKMAYLNRDLITEDMIHALYPDQLQEASRVTL